MKVSGLGIPSKVGSIARIAVLFAILTCASFFAEAQNDGQPAAAASTGAPTVAQVALTEDTQVSGDDPFEPIWSSPKFVVQDAAQMVAKIDLSRQIAPHESLLVWVYDRHDELVEVIDLRDVSEQKTITRTDGSMIKVSLIGAVKSELDVTVSAAGLLEEAEPSGIFGTRSNFVHSESLRSDASKRALDATGLLMIGFHARADEGIHALSKRFRLDFDACSGTLIANDKIMTAAHCPINETACQRTFVVFGHTDSISPKRVARRCDRVLFKNLVLDILVFSIDEPVTDREPIWFDLSQAPTNGRDLRIVQHPKATVKRISNDNACKVTKTKTYHWPFVAGTTAARKDIAFEHKCDTLGGSSGSPVFTDQWKLIGVHSAYDHHSERNYKTNLAVRSGSITSCFSLDQSGDLVFLNQDRRYCKNRIE